MSTPSNGTNQKLSGWHPTSKQENQKLSASAAWHLPGSVFTSRTRSFDKANRTSHNDDAASSPKRPRSLFVPMSTGATEVSSLTERSSASGTLTHRSVPKSTRLTLERDKLKSQMERHMKCPKCQSQVTVSFPTYCIASGSKVTCNNSFCNFVDVTTPAQASVPIPEGASQQIKRNIDWEANVLCMLAFLSVGDGGTEAGRLLGLLGLPNTTTFGPRSFGNIEEFVGPVLVQVADKLVYETNLVEEVRLSLGDKKDENNNLLFDLWKQGALEKKDWPQVTTSGDMGWQGRSSGNAYSSLSGDAVLVGQRTRKPIAWHVMGKACSFCQGWKRGIKGKNNKPIPDHDCRATWDGSSGAMEPVAILNMVVLLHQNWSVIVKDIITDDDSSMKAKFKWNNNDTMINKNLDEPPHTINSAGEKVVRPDKGNLPADMPEPRFLADPNHRKKSLANVLHGLESMKSAQKLTMTKMDVLRISTNFAHMVRMLPNQPGERHVECGKAVLEHHFDNHEFCGDWRSRKQLSQQERNQSTKCYRCKEKDAKSHYELKIRIECFITLEALLEVAHGMDAQCNESFNNVVAWIAPKNKVCSKSNSLKHRIAFALGVNALGMLGCYQNMFNMLGIMMNPSVLHYLTQMNKFRVHKIAKSKTADGKTKRVETCQRKLLEKTGRAKREKHRREGTYQPGLGMAAGCTENELAVAAQRFPGRQKKQTDDNTKKKRDPATMTCRTCKEIGHGLVTSSKCKHNADWKALKATKPPKGAKFEPPNCDDDPTSIDAAESSGSVESPLERDRGDCDLMDQLPLDECDYDDGMDKFFYAFEFPRDGDDNDDKEN